MNEVLKKIGDAGILPIMKIENAEDAVPVCRALMDGSLSLAEITFRTPAAEESIRRTAEELPDILLGAGTILSVEQVRKAVAAGAEFIVTPGFNPEVVEFCVEKGIPVVPGCSNPSDIEMALKFGLEVVKFFPAESFGGLKTLKAISAPYAMMSFIPTGGIGADNLNEYLAFDKVLACGGSWMTGEDLIKNRDFAEITARARASINKMLGFELAHIGINAPDAESSLKTAEKFQSIFNFPVKTGKGSNFAGTCIEVKKTKGPGTNGHIAIRTNSIPRAMAYLNKRGIEFDMSTLDESHGSINAIFLEEEIGGFAVHLLQRK